MLLADYNKAVAVVHRAGSTSMTSVDTGKKMLTPSEAESMSSDVDIIMWVRDPFERLTSAMNLLGKHRVLSGWRAGFPNVHWLPQAECHTDSKFYPNKIYAFEELNETWAKEFPGLELEHRKRTAVNKQSFEDFDLGHDTIEQLREYYADDFKLRKDLGYSA